jgi:hypothetical protein
LLLVARDHLRLTAAVAQAGELRFLKNERAL